MAPAGTDTSTSRSRDKQPSRPSPEATVSPAPDLAPPSASGSTPFPPFQQVAPSTDQRLTSLENTLSQLLSLLQQPGPVQPPLQQQSSLGQPQQPPPPQPPQTLPPTSGLPSPCVLLTYLALDSHKGFELLDFSHPPCPIPTSLVCSVCTYACAGLSMAYTLVAQKSAGIAIEISLTQLSRSSKHRWLLLRLGS
ncbi:hypothetical protein JB92DRAFT_3131008 [Gautieria morchelliformis]|nr:hypothetical protein JB92DRAFT_3131008 [Gautieria morchelliformis]